MTKIADPSTSSVLPRKTEMANPKRMSAREEDDNIMATNDSSIVSKRAAEILYYPQPHFLRYFVKKKKPRSPLISRGYWLRMQAIENVVRQFLDLPSNKRKIIINLGAGYDALPFQMFAKEPERCKNATFVDVDYPELVLKKCLMIKEAPSILELLKDVTFSTSEQDNAPLRSDKYILAGCDLNTPEHLNSFIEQNFRNEDDMFLLVAEVSISYMATHRANNIIRIASTLSNARFCLLEQFLPLGVEYPFARTMIAHFKKVKGELKSLETYPSLSHQRKRFRNAGWQSVQVRSLWQLWSDSRFISSESRMELNTKEPFDEWEDLALFASHYFLLVASTVQPDCTLYEGDDQDPVFDGGLPLSTHLRTDPIIATKRVKLTEVLSKGSQRLSGHLPPFQSRRFGAIYEEHQDIYGIHGGHVDSVGRTASTFHISSREHPNVTLSTAPKSLTARMCHTITALDNNRTHLLVGGRTSPNSALSDCWLLDEGGWKNTDSLPRPLYRHCATRILSPQVGVLIYGGRTTNGKPSDSWFVWFDGRGWSQIDCHGDVLGARFASSMATLPDTGVSGILIGGMSDDGTAFRRSFHWKLETIGDRFQIHIKQMEAPNIESFSRFGSSLVAAKDGYYLLGGVNIDGLPDRSDAIARLPYHAEQARWVPCEQDGAIFSKMLLMGHHTIRCTKGLIIVGGGAICFSFGSYLNTSLIKLDDDLGSKPGPWKVVERVKQDIPSLQAPRSSCLGNRLDAATNGVSAVDVSMIPSRDVKQSDFFPDLLKNHDPQPFVMHGLALGSCVNQWTNEYLVQKVEFDRQVIVHRASSEHMSFQPKDRNFNYITCSFQDFMQSIESGGREYFRALSHDKRDTPANFHQDFPTIAPDFSLPPELSFVMEKMHSSVLRISGPVAMWLHYDVMANVLCQVRGNKTLYLFPPSDVKYLNIPPGASSSSINVFAPGVFEKSPLIHTHPHKVELCAGQVLYIPPLWLHTAAPSGSTSIAVNAFFRDSDSGYAVGRDTYGNRDVHAYEQGRKDVKKILDRFKDLPPQMVQFYLHRLAGEIEQLDSHDA